MGQIIIRGVRFTAVALVAVCAAARSILSSTTPDSSAISRGSAFPDITDRISRSLTLAEGKAIRVEATIADVTVTGSTRSDVQIQIVRHAPTAAHLSRFAAVVEEMADGIRVAALQPDDDRDPNVKAEITIASPMTAPFQAVRVFEGRVRLANLKTACDVDLRRGSIEATGLAGRIRLESGLGSIDVRNAELTPGGMMRLRVFNGPLRVRFARQPANARILAVTFNGKIDSDIPLTKKDRFGPRFGETTLGTGDPVVSMDVVKGDISITVTR